MARVDNARYHLILLVKNEVGYKNLCRLLTAYIWKVFIISRELIKKSWRNITKDLSVFLVVSPEKSKLLRNGQMAQAEEVASTIKTYSTKIIIWRSNLHTPEIHEGLIALSKN